MITQESDNGSDRSDRSDRSDNSENSVGDESVSMDRTHNGGDTRSRSDSGNSGGLYDVQRAGDHDDHDEGSTRQANYDSESENSRLILINLVVIIIIVIATVIAMEIIIVLFQVLQVM